MRKTKVEMNKPVYLGQAILSDCTNQIRLYNNQSTESKLQSKLSKTEDTNKEKQTKKKRFTSWAIV